MARMFAGRELDAPLIMGVVNVTPDSFSDGGDHFGHETAIAHGRRLVAEKSFAASFPSSVTWPAPGR